MSSSDTLVGIINPRRKRRRGARRKKATATRRRRAPRKKRASTRRAPRRRARRRHVAAAAPAPKRRRRRGRVKARRRSLRGRRNPGALVLNPGRGGSLMATIKAAAPMILGTTGGLIGTRMASGMVAAYIPGGDNPWVRVGIRGALTLGGFYLLRRWSKKAAAGVLIGGGVATLEAGVQAVAPDFAARMGLSGSPQLLGIGEIRSAGMGSIETGMNGLACGELVSNY